jgi:methyltransferase (TIGR00027 family)
VARKVNAAAQTAFGPIVLAAVEHQEAEGHRLVDDELAGQFLPLGMRWLVGATRWPVARRLMIGASERTGPRLWANLACRKRYIDEKLNADLADIDAVVVLGAGLDTRAYRFAHRTDVPMFEVDLPVNIARKAATVRRVLGGPPPSVHLVPVDFERDDLAAGLAAHGYRQDYRTFFIWEGVTQYLTEAAVRATFDDLRDSAPSSRLVFTYVRRDFIDGQNLYDTPYTYRRMREKRQIWRFGMRTAEVPDFLAQYGWRVAEQVGPDYFLQHYIRPAGRDLGASELEWSVYAEKL